MSFSFLVAKIIAVIYISCGIGVLIGKINFYKIADEFKNSPALTFGAGLVSSSIGTILIHYHNIWISNWTVLITLLGWLCLIGGVIVIIFPQSVSFVSKYYKQSFLWGILMVCFGLLFGYFGFLS
jgi:uncharacterized membrane protein HdeD (DUF308 family)